MVEVERGPAGGQVYVRGVGAVSALGTDWPSTAGALARGASGIAPVSRFDASGLPCAVASVVDIEPDEGDRRLQLARAAALEAWREAAIDVSPARIGVFIGAEPARVSLRTLLELTAAAGGAVGFDAARLISDARHLAARLAPHRTSAAAVAPALAAEVGAAGPVQTVSLACASGSAAIAEAVRAIRLDRCEAALAGGVGADVDPLMFAGFGLLGALSERERSCPFDVRRDGFVIGEGAAMVVLGRERGAARCALRGLGRTLDAWRLTAPEPRGRGCERAMRLALQDAGLSAVDYVQAHGTSTPLNDAIEAGALRRVLGAHLDRARVSSVKGALGHWIAGAGALGVLCACEAISSGTVLPTAGLQEVDPDCRLPHVTGRAQRLPVEHALVNALGFGGANCSLVLGSA